MKPSERFVPTIRQLTGAPFIHHGYVFDREQARIVKACSHRHGARDRMGADKAQKCAERMTRQFVRAHERAEAMKASVGSNPKDAE